MLSRTHGRILEHVLVRHEHARRDQEPGAVADEAAVPAQHDPADRPPRGEALLEVRDVGKVVALEDALEPHPRGERIGDVALDGEPPRLDLLHGRLALLVDVHVLEQRVEVRGLRPRERRLESVGAGAHARIVPKLGQSLFPATHS